MILHANPWQDHNGASHRKNIDTPSLGGSCKAAKWFHAETCRKRTAYEHGGSSCNHGDYNWNRPERSSDGNTSRYLESHSIRRTA